MKSERDMFLRATGFVETVSEDLPPKTKMAILHWNSVCFHRLAWKFNTDPKLTHWRHNILKSRLGRWSKLLVGKEVHCGRRLRTHFARWKKTAQTDLYWSRYLRQRAVFASKGGIQEAAEVAVKATVTGNCDEDVSLSSLQSCSSFLTPEERQVVVPVRGAGGDRRHKKGEPSHSRRRTSSSSKTKGSERPHHMRLQNNQVDIHDSLAWSSTLQPGSWPKLPEMVNAFQTLHEHGKTREDRHTRSNLQGCEVSNAVIWCEVGQHYVSSTFHAGDVQQHSHCVLCEREYTLMDLSDKQRDRVLDRGRETILPLEALCQRKIRIEVLFDMKDALRAHRSKQLKLERFQKRIVGNQARRAFEKQVQDQLLQQETANLELGPPVWIEVFSGDHDQYYYWNSGSGETRWDQPAEYRMQAKDESMMKLVIRLQNAYRASKKQKEALLQGPNATWVKMTDEHGVSFMYNTATKEFIW